MGTIGLLTRSGIIVYYDSEDHELVSQYTWQVSKTSQKHYAVTTLEDGTKVYMHRMLLGCAPGDGVIVDHKDGCTINNCRYNIRKVTPKQNCWNIKFNKKTKTGYNGVCFHSRQPYKQYQARIYINGKRTSLGYFYTAEEAALAYNQKYVELQREIMKNV